MEIDRKLPKKITDILKLAGQAADETNCKAYIVGGFVRDLLLGIKNFDVDIAVEGNCLLLAKNLAEKTKGKYIYYKKYGTATVKWQKSKVDLAMSRKETYKRPAALPTVKFATIRKDLFRRDFTINAMAIRLNKGRLGELLDFYSGKSDLKKGIIKILHGKSFIDDPTRIFRAIRFEQRFGFKISKDTQRLMKQALKQGMLSKLEKYRLQNELVLILKETKPEKIILRMQQLGIFKFIKAEKLLSKKYATKLLKYLKK